MKLLYLGVIVFIVSCSSPKMAVHQPAQPDHPRYAPVPLVPKPAPAKFAMTRPVAPKYYK